MRAGGSERVFFIDNLLVRIHFIIVMIRWTGLAQWDFAFPFPGSLTSTFLDGVCQPKANLSRKSTWPLEVTSRQMSTRPLVVRAGGALRSGRVLSIEAWPVQVAYTQHPEP